MDILRRLFSPPEHDPDKNDMRAKAEEPTAPMKAAKPQDEDTPDETAKPVTTERETQELASIDPDFLLGDGATRPLPLDSTTSDRNEQLRFGQATDVGMIRNNNQDAVLSMFHASRSAENRPDFGLFVVADGMGGHHDGEKASATTTRVVAAHVTTNIYLPLLMANGKDNEDRPPISEVLIEAVQKANNDVIATVPEGGTTLTAVAVMGDLAYIVHVGDSRVYLITNDSTEQITRDHSLVQRLIELDQLTEEEAAEHPQKNVLYRAIGQSETLEVDAITRR